MGVCFSSLNRTLTSLRLGFLLPGGAGLRRIGAAQDPSMSYEALTLMQGVERSKRWGVGFYSFYHNTLVNSQLKLEKAYPKEAPDYLKPATRSPNPHTVPAGLVGDGS